MHENSDPATNSNGNVGNRSCECSTKGEKSRILCGSCRVNENLHSHQIKVEVQNVDSDLISILNKSWQIEGSRIDDDTDGQYF